MKFRNHSPVKSVTNFSVARLMMTGTMMLATSLNAFSGDILRGAYTSGGSATSSSTGGAPTPANTDAVRVRAQDVLQRSNQTLQAIQALQAAARAAAATGPNHLGTGLPDVPNGLGAGGLEVAPGASLNPALWNGADQPTESVDAGRTNVTVRQTTQQALMSWKTFNVGKETTLTFDQSAGGANVGQWIAFNKITDPSGNPTQILGSIKADGQVYIINSNGIIFGGSSQINVHSLTATALPLNDNLVARGLLNNPDAQFLFSALNIPAGGSTPGFTPSLPTNSSGRIGDVTVQQGAQISNTSHTAASGGRVVLIGGNVTNDGTISTPEGQTILAAGLQVGVAAHDSNDPTIRGLDVYVGSIAASGFGSGYGTVENNGLISVQRGNLTMSGASLGQFGMVDSSTSVALNGSIRMDASYNAITNNAYNPASSINNQPFLFKNTGYVQFGENSVMRILPEITDLDAVVGVELALRSQIDIRAKNVYMGVDSLLMAPNANVSIDSGLWSYEPSSTNPRSTFVHADGQVYLDTGAQINLAGSTDVAVSVAQNFLQVELRGSELADSPLQRDGVLRGATVVVDIRDSGVYHGQSWVGTALADVSGYVGLIERQVGQLTTAGGNLRIDAGSSVVTQPGSIIDVSGGFVHYVEGTVQSTRLLADGQLIDIASATPDRIYDGVYTGVGTYSSERWGASKRYKLPVTSGGEHFETGYYEGANAGAISITAPSMALDGNSLGQTVVGERQQREAVTGSSLPRTGTLTLQFQAERNIAPNFLTYSPTPPQVVIGDALSGVLVGPFDANNGVAASLDPSRVSTFVLSPDTVNEQGFGHLNISNVDGNILVSDGTILNMASGGSISLAGANVEVNGSIMVPSGDISLSAYNISPVAAIDLFKSASPVLPGANSGRGVVTLGSSAVVSSSGLLVVDQSASAYLPDTIGGGSVTIEAFSAVLNAGSLLDVSGGAFLSAKGKVSYGTPGSIRILTGQDLSLTDITGGELVLDGELRGFGGKGGGSLELRAPAVQIGGVRAAETRLWLSSDFFSQGGFESFVVRGIGQSTAAPDVYTPGVLISQDASIEPVLTGLTINYNAGLDAGVELVQYALPNGLRHSVDLTFEAIGKSDPFTNTLLARGSLLMQDGALIRTEAGGAISMLGQTVSLAGSISARGGRISVKGSGSYPSDLQTGYPRTTVLLTSTCELDASGTTVLVPDAYGRRMGTVYSGGTISLSGNVVGEAGSLLNVSGTSDFLDLGPWDLGINPQSTKLIYGMNTLPGGIQAIRTQVDSNGGNIILKGSQMLFVDSTLSGEAGGATALGGTLSVSSGRFVSGLNNTAAINLVVKQSGTTIPTGSVMPGIGDPVRNPNSSTVPGMGYFVADNFQNGGFDSLQLAGNVRFDGDVSLTARSAMEVANGGVIQADGHVSLAASYVSLGQGLLEPLNPGDQFFAFEQELATGGTAALNLLPTYGTGSLSVEADLIDVGILSLQGIGEAQLLAPEGDIRGSGSLDIAGHLTLQAGQIYPTTASSFTITAYDYTASSTNHAGSVTILGGNQRSLPYSAGGQLAVYASEIQQAGTLRAPLGTIILGWDGSGVQPRGLVTNQVAPVTTHLEVSSGSITSVSAYDPLTHSFLVLPYGLSPDGETWVDPSGIDITAGNFPVKRVLFGAESIDFQAGAQVDIRGGGDAYAYRWVEGNGGSQDILNSSGAFAVIPNYGAFYAPFAPFNTGAGADGLGNDPGYVNTALKVGDRIHLQGSAALAEGDYTLLPARYALLPGAVLVTPKSGDPVANVNQADGSALVGGYRYSSLNQERTVPTLSSRFEVAPASVVRLRAEYEDYLANKFLSNSATALGLDAPRLPLDAGQLAFLASSTLILNGSISASGGLLGRGGLVDIASQSDIVITAPGTLVSGGALALDSSQLSAYGAESLLIGGVRTFSGGVTGVNVITDNLDLDNAGSNLSVTDLVLVANDQMTLHLGSSVSATGSLPMGADSLSLVGDGLLTRISVDPNAAIQRRNLSTVTAPLLTVEGGVQLSGGSIILDSSDLSSLSSTALLNAGSITLNSGQISMVLDDSVATNPTGGLIIDGAALDALAAANHLSLLSYSSLDLYGAGLIGGPGLKSLELNAGQIRGYGLNGASASILADHISIGNSAGATALAAPSGTSGTLILGGRLLSLGSNELSIDGFDAVQLTGNEGIVTNSIGGLRVDGGLALTAPVLTGASGSTYHMISSGAFSFNPSGHAATVGGAVGASIDIQASSLAVNSSIILRSGLLSLSATQGDLNLGGTLDVSGTAQTFFDSVRYTDAGRVSLNSNLGNVSLLSGSLIDVSAAVEGGNAGLLSVSSPTGSFDANGEIRATGEQSGSFALDIGSLPTLAALSTTLNDASFYKSRSIRVRNGDVLVDGEHQAASFQLIADQGDVTVTGTIDASGVTGGEIDIQSSGSLVLANGSVLDASANSFSHAGKGGSVHLEAGSQIQGVIDSTALLDIQSGSLIDLSVADYVAGDQNTPGSSAFHGQFTGTLNLRAPLLAAGTDLAINPINGQVLGASAIRIEGYKLYDLTGSGAISTTVQNNIKSAGTTFGANFTAVSNRLLASNAGLAGQVVLRSGAEIINRTGDLTLSADWDLSTFRFGSKLAPGVLTLKAAGDLVFNGALSDGFNPLGAPSSAAANQKLWLAPLIAQNVNLPVNTQSYDYRLTAGADFGSAGYSEVKPVDSLAADKGNLLLGKNASQAIASGGRNATTASIIGNYFQVIRTGSGDIDIAAGRDVQLLNPFASIYSAGTAVLNPTRLFGVNDFVVPVVTSNFEPQTPGLGALQQKYFAQYSMAGGNVSISAGQDITRMTRNSANQLISDSSRQMPTNWLYRRGLVDSATGTFGSAGTGTGFFAVNDAAASTSWWVDFSNFFQDVATLGGGDVSLTAGRDVINVGASAATNARMSKGAPNISNLLELGGGDLLVRSGRDISGGVYYVQRGNGKLDAGGDITTNSTRSPSLGILTNTLNPQVYDSHTWLPTTLFLGDAQFDVSARGDVLLGPMANPFILPQGINNKFWYKTYFYNLDPDSQVNVSSLGGDLALRESAVMPSETSARSMLELWYQKQLLLDLIPNSAAWYQPWLRLSETSVSPFNVLFTTATPSLKATVFSGDINLTGVLNLFPSSVGQLELLANGSISGLNPAGVSTALVSGQNATAWVGSSINLSDASSEGLPGLTNPFAYSNLVGKAVNQGAATLPQFLDTYSAYFDESGALGQVLQTRQKLHAPGPLHAGDAESVKVYASSGSISGMTLYSPKVTQVAASENITDVAFYLQNNSASDISKVISGGDIIAYNNNTESLIAARADKNALAIGEGPQAGDIQINGPGTLMVLAGGNLDLGTGTQNSDGTASGITSVGNSRNPYLPFSGADLVVMAGLGSDLGLGMDSVDFTTFADDFLLTDSGKTYLDELGLTAAQFQSMDEAAQNLASLHAFYLVLRDAGRNASKGIGNYETGFAAVAALFPGTEWDGDILTRSRDIRTKNGGDISIAAPGGGLTLASTTIGNPLTPPGIVTEAGGTPYIYTRDNVDIGIGRIFALRGGNMVIWSSKGDIAAGSASKTVQAASPTRVVIDPQSADVSTDLAGLATGGGIGVLATVGGLQPGDVDLVAPTGVIDAGDAGIRASGNLNLAATAIVNASNISVGGSVAGAPAAPSVSVSVGSISTPPNATTSNSPTAQQDAAAQQNRDQSGGFTASIFTVEVIGYGGGSSSGDDEDKDKDKDKEQDNASQ